MSLLYIFSLLYYSTLETLLFQILFIFLLVKGISSLLLPSFRPVRKLCVLKIVGGILYTQLIGSDVCISQHEGTTLLQLILFYDWGKAAKISDIRFLRV